MEQSYKEHLELINQNIKEIIGIYRDAVKHLKVPETEFWIWYTLITIDGEHTQQDICSMWSLPKQSVNTVITRMRFKKYAYLETVPGTRNHKIVRLTDEGKKRGTELISPVMLAEEKALTNISHDELALINSVFGKYVDCIRNEFKQEATKGV